MATRAPAGNAAALQRLRPITTDYGDIVEDAVKDEEARAAAEEGSDEDDHEEGGDGDGQVARHCCCDGAPRRLALARVATVVLGVGGVRGNTAAW